MTRLALVSGAALVASCSAFAPMPACTAPALRTNAASSLRMSTYEDGKPKDLSKGNDFISIAIDSVRRIFTKSEDEYPRKEPALGFTQTPTKPQRNKGEWESK